MPTTYSINVSTIIEASRKTDIFQVLQDLPDNTQKLISPRDVRDAFLTTWANSSFKITSPGALSNEYIGLDSGDPSDRDLKYKILLGKRSYGNLDIMNNTLLTGSNADIFLYNTKTDSLSQDTTKISILAGTDSNLHLYAPYIESTATGSVMDLTIANPSLFGGPINVVSTTGRVAINGIVFPTVAETIANAGNGKILKYAGTYPSGYLVWADESLIITSIGSPTQATNLWGSPVNVNGFSMEFEDDSLVPYAVGGLTAGMSFSSNSFYNQYLGTYSDWPVSEIMRKILYPYILPVLQLSVTSPSGGKYIEAGVTTSLSFSYSITSYARDSSEWIRDYFIRNTTQAANPFLYYGSSFSGIPGTVLTNQFQYSTVSSVGTLTYSINASTFSSPFATSSAFPFGYNLTQTDSVQVVNPILFGFSNEVPGIIGTALSNVNQVITSMNKTLLPYPGTSASVYLSATGTGYLYFMYPSTFATDPQRVIDPNGFVIHDISAYSRDFFHSSQMYTPSINLFGSGSLIFDIKTDANDKIYCVGTINNYGGNVTKGIARLNKDGTFDTTYSGGYGPDGFPHLGSTASFNGTPKSIGIQSDGGLIVIGSFTQFKGATAGRIAKLTATGSLDPNFSHNGGFSGTGFSSVSSHQLLVQSDDKIMCVGILGSYNGSPTLTTNIVRLTSTGSVDATFNPGSGLNNRQAYAIEIQSDGKYLIGGARISSSGFTSYDANVLEFTPTTAANIMRIYSNGAFDGTFNPGLNHVRNGDILVIRQQSDGKILVGGSFTGGLWGIDFLTSSVIQLLVGRFIVRLNSDGSPDTTFFPATYWTSGSGVFDILIQPDGKIILTGNFSTFNNIANIIRLNPDGSPDLTFNSQPGVTSRLNSNGYTLHGESDGKILVGGLFTVYGTSSADVRYNRQRIARINSDGTIYTPVIYSSFNATASTWLHGNPISASPYSGSYDVWVTKQPVTYNSNGGFQFIF